MTETEAKTKKCPLFSVTMAVVGATAVYGKLNGAGDAACQRLIKDATENCIGSACMMWRWQPDRIPLGGIALEISKVDGYCGLVGRT